MPILSNLEGKKVQPKSAEANLTNQVTSNECSLYEIERVIGRRLDNLYIGSKEYLVKWMGFSKEESTWEPYRSASDPEWANDLHHIRAFEEILSKNNAEADLFGGNDSDSSLTSVIDSDEDKNVFSAEIQSSSAHIAKPSLSFLEPIDQNTGSILQDSCADHPNPRSTSRITPKAQSANRNLTPHLIPPIGF